MTDRDSTCRMTRGEIVNGFFRNSRARTTYTKDVGYYSWQPAGRAYTVAPPSRTNTSCCMIRLYSQQHHIVQQTCIIMFPNLIDSLQLKYQGNGINKTSRVQLIVGFLTIDILGKHAVCSEF